MRTLTEDIKQHDIRINGFMNSKSDDSLVITCRPFEWLENKYENADRKTYAVPYTTHQHLIPLEEYKNESNKYKKVFYYRLPQQHTSKNSDKRLINVLIVEKESDTELTISFIDAYTRYHAIHQCILKNGIYEVV